MPKRTAQQYLANPQQYKREDSLGNRHQKRVFKTDHAHHFIFRPAYYPDFSASLHTLPNDRRPTLQALH
jgi:hypothetical protein